MRTVPIPDPTPWDIAYALEVPVNSTEGIDVVWTPNGAVFMRIVAGGEVKMMNPTDAEHLRSLGADLTEAAARLELRIKDRVAKRIAGQN